MTELFKGNRSCTPPTEERELLPTPSASFRSCHHQHHRKVKLVVLWASLFPEYVCKYLDPQDVVRLGQTSRQLAAVVRQPHVWRTLLQAHFRFTAADCVLLDRVMMHEAAPLPHATGTGAHLADSSSPIGSPTVDLKRSGCTIDHLMLAPGMPRLARVVQRMRTGGATPFDVRTPLAESRVKYLPSPIRPLSRDAAGTVSYGTTPTPQRSRPSHHHHHPQAASMWSSTTSPAEFHIRATVQQLIGGTNNATPTPLLRTAAASSELTVQWAEVEERPASHAFGVGGGTASSHFVYHTEHAVVSPAFNPLEPLLFATAPSSPNADDEEDTLHHDGGQGYNSNSSSGVYDCSDGFNPLEPMEYGTVADDDYSSGALFLGGGQHQRLTELWERRDSGTPATDTTLLHVSSMQRAWDEGTYRSGSLASCYYATENRTVPATPVCTTATHHPSYVEQGQASFAPWTSPSTPTVVATVCCAETLAASLRYDQAPYPLQKLFQFVYTRRVRNFVAVVAARRLEACKAITYERDAEALALLTLSIENAMEGGCGRSNAIREALVCDLVLRGRVFRTMQRDDEAIGDFAMAHLLDPTCTEAYAESSVITTAAQRCSVNASRILSPNFVLEHAYEQLLQDGKSLMERAAFLYEVLFWRGPSLMLYIYQYLLCDAIRVWPVRLLLAAEELAQTPSERLMVRAWILLDSGDGDKAAATAELAVSLLPPEVTRTIDDTERVCVQAARRLMQSWSSSSSSSGVEEGEGNGPDGAPLSGVSNAATGPSHNIFCEQLRRVQDVNVAAVLIAAHPWGQAVGYDTSPCADVYSTLRQHFNHPSAISPSASFTFFTLAFMAGGTDVGVEAYRRHIFTRPCASRLGTALNNVGHLLIKRQEAPVAALELFEAARRAFPVHNGTLTSLARCYAQLGRMREAYDTLSQVAESSTFTGRRADTLFERARVTTSPMPDLLRATEIDPRCSQPYRLRAAMAMDRGDIQEALREMTTLIELTLEASDVALRALFRRDSGDRRGAIRDMALACTLMPSRKDYRATLDELVAEEAHTLWLGANHIHVGTASDADDEDLRIADLPIASVFRAAAGWGAVPAAAGASVGISRPVVGREHQAVAVPPRASATEAEENRENTEADGGLALEAMTPVLPSSLVEESAQAMMDIARWL